MFEDSTFESNGRIKTRSRRWMIATFALNGTALALIVLLPLVHPDALERKFISVALIAPPDAPSQPPKTMVVRNEQRSEFAGPDLIAPTKIPSFIKIDRDSDPPAASFDPGTGVPGSNTPPALVTLARPQPHVEPLQKIRISSSVIDGLLVDKKLPNYPQIAVETHTQGTVVLAAVISTQGTIENLRVVGGPPMLRQSALDAVRQWHYRPYMLNGEPVEVETTINVVFTLNN